MPYELVVKQGDCSFRSACEELPPMSRFAFSGYVRDDEGNVCGVECTADLGHGHGFDYGQETFVLREGESYSFAHSFTSIDGPSDWSEDSVDVTVRLERV